MNDISTKELKFKYEIGKYIESHNITIIDKKIDTKIYINPKTNKLNNVRRKFYQYTCNKCGYIGWKIEGDIYLTGCPCCRGLVAVKGINTIGDKRPELIQYFQNKDDAYTVTVGSHAIVKLVCPLCGHKIEIEAKRFVYNGFVCNRCGDHISYPEKFMMSFLDQLNINYIFQLSKKHFDWCENHKYDFYLPDYNCIIETNGSQHYNDAFNRSIHETISIDLYKKSLAYVNNIEHYIWVDCTFSDINFIKNSIEDSELIKKLNLDISCVDFELCGKEASKNLLKTVCDFYNEHQDMTTSEIAPFFHVHPATIWQYLKKGAKLGFCNYDVELSKRKSILRTTKICAINRSKPVECFKDNISLGIFFNAVNTCKYFNKIYNVSLHKTGVGAVCLGKIKQHKGYTFKYITKEEYESRPQDQRDLPEEEVSD